MPPLKVVWWGAYYFCPVRPCVRPKTLPWYFAQYLINITKLTPTMHYGTEMNVSQFGVSKCQTSRSRWNNVLETALYGLVNTVSWKALVIFSRNLHQWCIAGQMIVLHFGGKRTKVRTLEPSLQRPRLQYSTSRFRLSSYGAVIVRIHVLHYKTAE